MLSGNLKAPRPRGFDFEHELVKSIADAYATRKFGLWFSTYRAVNVPSLVTFCKRCRLVFWTCIHVWATYPTKPANKDIHGICAKLSALFQKVSGVGELIAMHGVQMMSEMGLLPLWLQTYAALNHAGRVHRQLVSQFVLGKNRTEARKVMKTLKAGLVEKLGHTINEVIIENLACKKAVQRDTTRRGRPVYDVHHRRAPLVQCREDGDGISILMSDT
jgi:hypothetical protein